MKRFWCLAILCAGLGLTFTGTSPHQFVLAQRRQAPPPATKMTTPPTPAQPPATTSIPIYESSGPSSKNTPQAKPGQPQKRQLAPLDQLRFGGYSVLALDGTEVPMSELLTVSHPTLIQFWRTGCEQSQAQIAFMNDVAARYRQRGLVMLALTIDSPEQRRNVGNFVRQERITYPVYFAPPNLYRLMSGGMTGTPQTYIFSRDGRIANRLIGWEPKRGRPALEAALEATY